MVYTRPNRLPTKALSFFFFALGSACQQGRKITLMKLNQILILIVTGVLGAVLLRRSLITHSETERQAAEETERLEAERQAAEEAARREAERKAAAGALQQEEVQRQILAATVPIIGSKVKAPEQTVVMVADDSKVVRVKTGRLLTTHKYQVLMAEDGLDAARQIENSVPDLLITDVDMPGMGGMELVRQLRNHGRTVNIPIIMITSDSDVLRREAVESGVNVVLGKPYPEEQLITHIQQLMIDRISD